MKKLEMITKLEVAYQLVSQVHSELCQVSARKQGITDESLDLTNQILLLSERIKKEIPDNIVDFLERKTAADIETKIREALWSGSNGGAEIFTFDAVEGIVCKATKEFMEGR